MATNTRPENALKQAENFMAVGSPLAALETLDQAIRHKRWKNNWSIVHEQIMLKHLELCVELKKFNYARDGLHQYRTTCQAANIASLEKVVQEFRKMAEGKVNEAQAQNMAAQDIATLDEEEPLLPAHQIMLQAIQSNDTRQQSQDRDVASHYKFLWETYKAVMDVLKTHPRLEEVYHETVRWAFEFCRAHKRPQEFKRLCDIVKRNWEDLSKPKGNNQNHVNPNNPETISRTLETRYAQIRTATELDMWREAYNTAEKIYELINRVKAKPKQRSDYYEFLSQIFWKSDNYLFHSFACLKNSLLINNTKKDLTPVEKQALASKAVMATLCIPFQRHADSVHSTLEIASEELYQKAKKHAALFNAQSVPTRESIIQQLGEKSLISFALEPVKKLFELIESDFTPLSLCQDATPYLDEIAKIEALEEYVTPVKRIIFLRLMKQLSEVYANMTISNFEKAASIVEFSIAEKWMADAARQQGINVQINHREQAIVFGATRKVDMKSMKQPLIEIGHKLQQAMQRVAPLEQHKKEKLEKSELLKNIGQRMKEELRKNRERRDIIEQRKEEAERRRYDHEQAELMRQAKEEARSKEAERIRIEREKIKREEERKEQKKIADSLSKVKQQLTQINSGSMKIGNKKVVDMSEQELLNIGLGEIEAAHETQVKRERHAKIKDRKNEGKRVDHLARAFREQENAKLDDWQDDVDEADSNFLDLADDKEHDRQEAQHAEQLKEKESLMQFQSAKKEWVEERLEERYEEHIQEMKEKNKKAQEKAVEEKIKRARERKEEAKASKKKREEDEKKKKKEAEEKRKRDAEEAERQREEEERKREEEERIAAEDAERQARAKKRAEERAQMEEMNRRAEEKRRAKEAEIEARLSGGGKSDQVEPEPAPQRGGWRDREDREIRRGGEREDREIRRGGDREDWKSKGVERTTSWRDGKRDDDQDDRNTSWRDRDQRRRSDDEDKTPKGAWGSKSNKNDDNEGSWRRQAPAEDDRQRQSRQPPRENAWGSRGKPRDDDEDDRQQQPRQPPRENAWGNRGKSRDDDDDSKVTRSSGGREDARRNDAAEDDDEGFQPVSSKKKPASKPAEEPVKPAAEEVDDDGFEAVTSKKKKGKKDTGATEESETREPPASTPPWKRGSTTSTAKPDNSTAKKDRPWNKPK